MSTESHTDVIEKKIESISDLDVADLNSDAYKDRKVQILAERNVRYKKFYDIVSQIYGVVASFIDKNNVSVKDVSVDSINEESANFSSMLHDVFAILQRDPIPIIQFTNECAGVLENLLQFINDLSPQHIYTDVIEYLKERDITSYTQPIPTKTLENVIQANITKTKESDKRFIDGVVKTFVKFTLPKYLTTPVSYDVNIEVYIGNVLTSLQKSETDARTQSETDVKPETDTFINNVIAKEKAYINELMKSKLVSVLQMLLDITAMDDIGNQKLIFDKIHKLINQIEHIKMVTSGVISGGCHVVNGLVYPDAPIQILHPVFTSIENYLRHGTNWQDTFTNDDWILLNSYMHNYIPKHVTSDIFRNMSDKSACDVFMEYMNIFIKNKDDATQV